MISATRKTGLLALGAGLAVALIGGMLAASFNVLQVQGVVMLLAVPGALAFAGLGQLVTGISFWQMASRWDSFQGWQRGVLGVLIVLAAAALIFAFMAALVVTGAA